MSEAQQGFDLFGQPGFRPSRGDAHQPEVLRRGQVRIQQRLIGHVAEPGFVFQPAVLQGNTLEQYVAAGRLEQPGEHFHRGAFAGAVRTKANRSRGRRNGDAYILNRGESVVALGQPDGLQHRLPSSWYARTICDPTVGPAPGAGFLTKWRWSNEQRPPRGRAAAPRPPRDCFPRAVCLAGKADARHPCSRYRADQDRRSPRWYYPTGV